MAKQARLLLLCFVWSLALSVPIVSRNELEQKVLQDDVLSIRAPITGSVDHRTVRLSRISGGGVQSSLEQPHSLETRWPTYSSRFQHSWKRFYLDTGRVPAHGVPSLGEGSRVLVIGDPCTARNQLATLADCMEKKLNTTHRIPEILSVLSKHVDAVLILGDNFYDSSGAVSMRTFAAVQTLREGKQPLLMTVPGNHDFWIAGQPKFGVPWDQRGWGFLQFYGQDSVALRSSASYNFTPGERRLPDASNFFWYTVLGSVGYVGFSGAHSWAEQEPHFRDACGFFRAYDRNTTAVFLAGHWSDTREKRMGALLDTPQAYRQMLELCPELAPKLYHIFGHRHCNRAMADGRGFMVGAAGMEMVGCEDDFGFVVIDAADAEGLSVDYFQLASRTPGKGYDDVIACLRRADAYQECRREYARDWMR